MKILHVAPSIARSYGGPTQSLSGYVTASRSMGAEVTVAAPLAEPDEISVMESAAGVGNVHTFRSFGRGAFIGSPSMMRWVASRASDYDVVHVHGLFNPISTLCCRSAIKSGRPVVLRPFGTLSRYTLEHRRSSLKRTYFWLLEHDNVADCSALHFTTTAERDEARWHRIELGDRAHVIPPPWIRDTIPTSRADSGPPQVLFMGRINPVKNIEVLLDAWPLVMESIPDAQLVIAGSGASHYVESLKARAGRLRIADRVAFSGFVSGDEKAKALASATVFALPSHHENFGVVVLEAIAAGLPVVISPTVQLRDFVESNSLGTVADASPRAFADAISAALFNEALRRRVLDNGASLVEATFAPELIGEKLRTMYLDAIENRRNRKERDFG